MFQQNPHFQETTPLGPISSTPLDWWQALDWQALAPLVVLALVILALAVAAIRALTSEPARKPRGRGWHDAGKMHVSRIAPAYKYKPPPTPAGPAPNLRDPAQQMHAISKAGFETVPLLNKSEARLLPALEAVVRRRGDHHRLMAQTCLGEILRPTGDLDDRARDDAFYSINAKRLDFAVFNRFGHLVAAIEYQGHAHYHTASFMRDAIKREVMRKAGVPFLELEAGINPEAAAAQLAEVLGVRMPPKKNVADVIPLGRKSGGPPVQ